MEIDLRTLCQQNSSLSIADLVSAAQRRRLLCICYQSNRNRPLENESTDVSGVHRDQEAMVVDSGATAAMGTAEAPRSASPNHPGDDPQTVLVRPTGVMMDTAAMAGMGSRVLGPGVPGLRSAMDVVEVPGKRGRKAQEHPKATPSSCLQVCRFSMDGDQVSRE